MEVREKWCEPELLRGRLAVGRWALNPETDVRIVPPELELWIANCELLIANRRQKGSGQATVGVRVDQQLAISDPRFPVEAIRPDEGPVLKTGGGVTPLVGSSPTASASPRYANWQSGAA